MCLEIQPHKVAVIHYAALKRTDKIRSLEVAWALAPVSHILATPMPVVTGAVEMPGLPSGLHFNVHTHPISTEKPVGIPTESLFPQNHKILHTPTPHPVSFRLMHVLRFVMYTVRMYSTAWCMKIVIQYVRIRSRLTKKAKTKTLDHSLV